MRKTEHENTSGKVFNPVATNGRTDRRCQKLQVAHKDAGDTTQQFIVFNYRTSDPTQRDRRLTEGRGTTIDGLMMVLFATREPSEYDLM